MLTPLKLLTLLAIAAALAVACSGDAPAAEPPAPTPAEGGALSFVYIDSRQQQGLVMVAAFDGSSPRTAAPLPAGARALDVADRWLALGNGAQLTLLDLATGQSRSLTANAPINDARFVDATTLLYTTRTGCGPTPSASSLVRVDVTGLQQKELAALGAAGANILDVSDDAGQVILAPRGCDVSVSELRLYNLSTGALVRSFLAEGCGWAAATIQFARALASWKACNPPAAHAASDATFYDFRSPTVASREVKAPPDGANNQPFLIRPGKAQAALGVSFNRGIVPGQAAGNGVYLLNFDDLSFDQVWQAQGLEQFPVDWSPDGRYLLAAYVEAQGVCSFFALEANTKAIRPIDSAVNVCGANGQVIGWSQVR